jgi:hypothetical protein
LLLERAGTSCCWNTLLLSVGLFSGGLSLPSITNIFSVVDSTHLFSLAYILERNLLG